MSLPPLLLLLILAAAGLLAAAILDLRPAGRSKLVKRARAMGQARQGAPAARQDSVLKGAAEGGLEGLVGRLVPRPAALRARLEGTGYGITFAQYGLASLAVGLAGLVLGMLVGAPPLLAVLEGLALGVWTPHAAVGFLMARRRGAFLKHFPEAIGLIVRGLKAGLPTSETIGVVGREIGGPVGAEFRAAADQIRLGRSIEEALWIGAKRIGLPEFNFLVISLSVQRETGGNLTETLENLEHILRRRQQMRLKVRAMSSEATASALIIGALPFVMAGLMYMVSGEYMRLLFTEPLGQLMMGAALASLTVGGFVMRKMVRFEI